MNDLAWTGRLRSLIARKSLISKIAPLSIVIIGRNEGPRLSRCIESVRAMHKPAGRVVDIIYVDSASSDASAETARRAGVRTIELREGRLCAAIARNTGWKASSGDLILFLDADTTLAPDFVAAAIGEFDDIEVAVVYGNRRELNPQASIFTRVLDLDWIPPRGVYEFCGGDALMRRSALQQVGGFDEKLIAGEEPELCWRIRSHGYKVVHVDRMMSHHELGITRMSQYWRRAVRTGYAYAEISGRCRASKFPLWSKEARRNQINSVAILLLVFGSLIMSIGFRSATPMLLGVATFAMLAIRTAIRNRWKVTDLVTLLLYGVHSHLQQVPMLQGQIEYRLHRRGGNAPRLIEYKRVVGSAQDLGDETKLADELSVPACRSKCNPHRDLPTR